MNFLEGATVSSILTDISSVVTSGMTWLGDAVTAVTGSPLLFVACTFGFIGTGIGLMRRIIG